MIEAQCRYVKSARYDDLLSITTRVIPDNRLRVRFTYEIYRTEDNTLLATGTTHHVSMDGRGKPKRLPETVVRLLK